jgi:hypothetical protein
MEMARRNEDLGRNTHLFRCTAAALGDVMLKESRCLSN